MELAAWPCVTGSVLSFYNGQHVTEAMCEDRIGTNLIAIDDSVIGGRRSVLLRPELVVAIRDSKRALDTLHDGGQ